MAQNNIVPFTIKVQRELHSDASFDVEFVYDGVYKAWLKIPDVLNPVDGDVRNLTWFGIGNSERDAKETAVDKACKFLGWIL